MTTTRTSLEKQALKGRLLTKYADREPRPFIQYDAFATSGPDSLFGGGFTFELMRGSGCRVLIDPETSSADAVAMLRSITDWIERDGLIQSNVTNDPNDDDVPF